MTKKKKFRDLIGGDWFTYRNALYIKIGPLLAYKHSGKPCKVVVGFATRHEFFFGDFVCRSLVTPVKVSIRVR